MHTPTPTTIYSINNKSLTFLPVRFLFFFFSRQVSVEQLQVVAAYNWAREAALKPHPGLAKATPELAAIATSAVESFAVPPSSALVEGARRGDAQLAVQFGGQGVDYLQELRDA
jgi:hypothetical protein